MSTPRPSMVRSIALSSEPPTRSTPNPSSVHVLPLQEKKSKGNPSTMASGCVTRAGLATTTCTRSTVKPPSMALVMYNEITSSHSVMSLAFRSSKPQ
ncbi:hypothetical protein BAE44_0014579 [Dichanthelium oligosanthes]|uniref:Uncharacterized protein n=1 Tax=Dichanthelium oligosanthes TaxID=888268 RepID=A0A1E5VGZ7_9POAL|nr:hypothetical protein BAE44_0014579 [Dichanthelium oligosanthes]